MLYIKGVFRGQHQYKHRATPQKQKSRECLSENLTKNICIMSVPCDRPECFKNGAGSVGANENGDQDHLNAFYEWRPGDIINGDFESCKGFACLVLNRIIQIPSSVVRVLWQNGTFWELLKLCNQRHLIEFN